MGTDGRITLLEVERVCTAYPDVAKFLGFDVRKLPTLFSGEDKLITWTEFSNFFSANHVEVGCFPDMPQHVLERMLYDRLCYNLEFLTLFDVASVWEKNSVLGEFLLPQDSDAVHSAAVATLRGILAAGKGTDAQVLTLAEFHQFIKSLHWGGAVATLSP